MTRSDERVEVEGFCVTNRRNKESQECSELSRTTLLSFLSSQCELRSKWQPEQEVRPNQHRQDCTGLYVMAKPEKPREAMLYYASQDAPIRAL